MSNALRRGRFPLVLGVVSCALATAGCDGEPGRVGQTAVGDETNGVGGSSSDAGGASPGGASLGGAESMDAGDVPSGGEQPTGMGGSSSVDLSCDSPDGDTDLVAHRVRVSGVLTVGGEVASNYFGDAAAENALIAFVDDRTGIQESLWVVPGSGGVYDVVLGAGVYDVQVSTSGLGGRATLLEGVTLDASQSLDIDMTVVDLAGEVTLNGAPMPESDQERGRGVLVFRPEDESFGSVSVVLPLTGAATYQVRLPATAAYDVRWTHSATVRAEATPPAAAANAVPFGEIAFGQVSGDSGDVTDFDVTGTIHDVQGAVTANGDALVDASRPEATQVALIQFHPGGPTVELTGSQPNEFRFALLEGSYDVSVLVTAQIDPLPVYASLSVCTECRPDEIGDIELLDYYATEPPVGVTGRLQLSGDGWPSEAQPDPGARGTLSFVRPALDPNVLPTAAPMGPVADDGTFTVDVPPGTYDVVYANTRGIAGRTVVARDFALDADVTDLELVARVVPFQAEILVNGQPMSDDALLDDSPRGQVRLGSQGVPVTFGLGETGPARFGGPLLEGEYEMWLETWAYLGRTNVQMHSQSVLPGGTRWLGSVSITSQLTQPYVVNVGVRRVRGSLTHTGVENVVPSGDTQVLRFIDPDGQAFPLAAPMDAEFELLLYDGAYRAEVGDANSSPEVDDGPTFDDFVLDGERRLLRSVALREICVGETP